MPDIFIARHKIKSPHIHIPEEKAHIFSSFCRNPSDIFFKNQEPNEKVLLFLRKHMVTNLKWITISVILLVAPLITTFIMPFLSLLNIQFISLPSRYIVFLQLLYYLSVFTYIYVNFITWYFNISFVTNIRVVDIDFSNLIYKNIAATKLSLVQDVSFDQVGVIPTFFNYGDVFVQTAGTEINFEFLEVPQPEDVVHIIHELIGKHGTV